MATTTKRVLLISEPGEVGCTEPSHAPFRGSDTWHRERWHEMTFRERTDFAAEIGREPTCETCAAIARAGGAA